MITGRWGKPNEVLLDIVVDADGSVRGVANPGRQDAAIKRGHFDAATGSVELAGDYLRDGETIPFHATGRLEGRTLRLRYRFGELEGEVALVRVEEYQPPPLTLWQRIEPRLAALKRWIDARSRPTGAENARKLRERGESLDSIVLREATVADIPALSELHVLLWNKTYNTSRGPTVVTRTWQWNQVFAKQKRRDFVLVLEDGNGRLIGFTWGKPHEGIFKGEVSKIYLRWEYHGLGLGRIMFRETARRFIERGIGSCILHAELSNPTIGFYDRMGGERLRDEHGRINGAFGWRDVRTLLR